MNHPIIYIKDSQCQSVKLSGSVERLRERLRLFMQLSYGSPHLQGAGCCVGILKLGVCLLFRAFDKFRQKWFLAICTWIIQSSWNVFPSLQRHCLTRVSIFISTFSSFPLLSNCFSQNTLHATFDQDWLYWNSWQLKTFYHFCFSRSCMHLKWLVFPSKWQKMILNFEVKYCQEINIFYLNAQPLRPI